MVILKGDKVQIRSQCAHHAYCGIYTEITKNIPASKAETKVSDLVGYKFLVDGIFYTSEDRSFLVRCLDYEEMKHRRFMIPDWLVEKV